MIPLSEEQRTVLEFLAEEPHPPIKPLKPFVAELMAMGLVVLADDGQWTITPAGAQALRGCERLQ